MEIYVLLWQNYAQVVLAQIIKADICPPLRLKYAGFFMPLMAPQLFLSMYLETIYYVR